MILVAARLKALQAPSLPGSDQTCGEAGTKEREKGKLRRETTGDVLGMFTQITPESVFSWSPSMPACQVGLGLARGQSVHFVLWRGYP
jgi:hypothetical protein